MMLMASLASSKKATTPTRLTLVFYLAVAMVTLDCHFSKENLIKAVKSSFKAPLVFSNKTDTKLKLITLSKIKICKYIYVDELI